MARGVKPSEPVGGLWQSRIHAKERDEYDPGMADQATTTAPFYGPIRAPLRGSPSRYKNHMEQFQLGYIRSIAAASGVVVSEPVIDEGIDVFLTHRSEEHTAKDDGAARLEVQLKSTGVRFSADGSRVSASMRMDRYDYYRTADPVLPKIVVIMHVPKLQDEWIRETTDSLQLHHLGYWVNLSGLPAGDPENETKTVSALTSNIFTDHTLCAMMARIGKGEQP